MFGEDFTDVLANCDWKQDNTTFPMLRVALACCQVTSPKSSQKDGFAKLILKSDFDKLKGKKLLPNLLKAEALMLTAWEAIQKSGLPVERIALPFGKLQVRLALWLLDKEMKGREVTKYEEMKQIKDMFETELAACSTQQDSGAASASTTSSSACPGGPVKALELAPDPKSIALAQHKHIKLNGLYIYKGGDKVYSWQEMKDDGALLLHAPYFGNTEEMRVKLADLKFLKEWKKPRPALIADDVREQLLPSQSPMLEQEQATAQAQCALYEKHKESQGCIFFFAMLGDFEVLVSNQNEVFAGAKYNKGKLQLLPMGTLQLLPVAKASKGACIIKSKDLENEGYLAQPWKFDFNKKAGLFCPFWMVKEGEDKDDSCLTRSTVKVGNLHIPCFTNKEPIEKGCPLLVEPDDTSSPKKKRSGAK
eukprot:s1829_g2.t1